MSRALPANVKAFLDSRSATPGFKSRKARIEELEAENASLRKRLEMTEPVILTEWESFGTPRIRAELAARALYQSHCNPIWAMKLLGFEKDVAHDKAAQNRILRSSEVMKFLENMFAAPRELRKAVVDRTTEISLLGTDGDSVRATGHLAKLMGWVKNDPAQVNVHTLVGLMNPGQAQEKQAEVVASDDVLSILSHEPGAPVRINTGDKAVERALSEAQE